MIRKIAWCLILFLITEFTFASAKTTREIYQENRDSIVLLISYDRQGVPSALGSGFYISPNRIVTNQHVIEGSSRVVYRVIGSRDSKEVKRIIARSSSLDLAILETEGPGKPVTLGSKLPEIGDKVVAIGNPRGLEGSVSEGIVSAVRTQNDFSFVQITAPISPGSSGGPLFAEDGNVIGVTTATLRDSQNLNFAVPTSLLAKLEEKGAQWEPEISAIASQQERGSAGVELVTPIFDDIFGNFAYSLRNTNHRAINKLSYLLIFKSIDGTPLHFITRHDKELIPPGLAQRLSVKHDNAIKGFMVRGQNTYPWRIGQDVQQLVDVELRILTFDYVGSSPEDNLLGESPK